MDLALFDFDGTITDRETMPSFMRAAVRPYRKFLGGIFLLPLILGYKAKLVSGTVIRAAISYVGFWRIPTHEVEVRPSIRRELPAHDAAARSHGANRLA
jgi:phosphatidylglycerophosphatase C